MDKYVLLKNGAIFVLVNENTDGDYIECRIRGSSEKKSFKVNPKNVELMGYDMDGLRNIKNGHVKYTHLLDKIYVFNKTEIRDMIKKNDDKYFYFQKKENIDEVRKKDEIYDGRDNGEFFYLNINESEKLYIPKNLHEVLVITTPFNSPKYIIKNINYSNKDIHDKYEYDKATIIIIDDKHTNYISITTDYINQNNLEKLDMEMSKIGFKLLSSLSCSANIEDNNIIQKTYKK